MVNRQQGVWAGPRGAGQAGASILVTGSSLSLRGLRGSEKEKGLDGETFNITPAFRAGGPVIPVIHSFIHLFTVRDVF